MMILDIDKNGIIDINEFKSLTEGRTYFQNE